MISFGWMILKNLSLSTLRENAELQNHLSFHKENWTVMNSLIALTVFFVSCKPMRVGHSKKKSIINNVGSVGVSFRTSSLSLHVYFHRYADDTLLYLRLSSQLHTDVTHLQNCLTHVVLRLNEDKIVIMTVLALGFPVLCWKPLLLCYVLHSTSCLCLFPHHVSAHVCVSLVNERRCI